MSGHSKWSKIKHKKALNDAKKGKVFSKLAQQISVAARDGGGDAETNFSLRLLLDKAKAASMPAENVQRAIDKGAGKGADALQVEEVVYEGFGPDGVAIMVVTITDNKNRTISEMRSAFADNGGSIGDNGSVAWNFDQRGLVSLRPAKMKKSEKYGHADTVEEFDTEEVMMEIMEIGGIVDMKEYMELDESTGEKVQIIDLYTEFKDLAKVRDAVNSLGYIVLSADVVWVPKMYKKDFDPEKLEKFIEALEDFDDVQSVFTDTE